VKLEFDSVSKSFGDRMVIDRIDVSFLDVRTLALIGPSGGGKSTLLRIIAGLEPPDSGDVRINGHRIDFSSEARLREHRRHVGVVFQAFNLFPHLTALENLVLPLEKVHGIAGAASRARAMEMLERFRLASHAHQRPAELSGGQKQRIAIARAVAIKPQLLLLDEPTSALDPEMTAEVLDVIAELKAEGRDLLLVTHEMGFAREVADEAAFLADGRIIEAAPARTLFSEPKTAQVRDFLGRILRY
jgi:polar amino acid transport system ATP-binding protein